MPLSTEQPNTSVDDIPAQPEKRVRLGYLDGLRGLAALYVVIHHAAFSHYNPSTLPHWLRLAIKPLAYGHFSVAVFIVLSGYCLMLPVARSIDATPPLLGAGGPFFLCGFTGFVRRRARSILPPYYAALALALLLDWIVVCWIHPAGLNWHGLAPALSMPVIVSHLFLIHNLSPGWIEMIDVPMWSVATEWQIYFVFALVLLPVWRRFGIWPTIAVAFILGLAPHYLMTHPALLDGARYWYIGLFALGMAAAVVNFRPDMSTLRDKTPRLTLAAIFGLSMIAASAAMPGYWTRHPWLIDPWAGIAAACLLVGLTRVLTSNAAHPSLLRHLDAPSTRKLGDFSYSLYLIHNPVQQLIASIVGKKEHL